MREPRILIVRVGAMGDVLHALPAVAALRAALPAAHLGWAVDPRWAPLLRSRTEDAPYVDTIHLVNTRQWTATNFLPQVLKLRHELRAERYDMAVDLQGSIRSAIISRLANSEQITGSASPREKPARFLYTQRVELASANVIDQAAELLASASDRKIEPAKTTLPLDPEAEAWVVNHARTPFVLIAPTAGWGAKEWPPDRYIALIERLQREGHRVLLNAAPLRTVGVSHDIAQASGAEVLPSTLPQMIALIRRADLVVGGDTGPVHLAAALGRPTLALFGPTDPARNGPLFPGARTITLRHPASRTDHHRTPVTDAGLKQISVEEVFEAASALLQPRPGV